MWLSECVCVPAAHPLAVADCLQVCLNYFINEFISCCFNQLTTRTTTTTPLYTSPPAISQRIKYFVIDYVCMCVYGYRQC